MGPLITYPLNDCLRDFYDKLHTGLLIIPSMWVPGIWKAKTYEATNYPLNVILGNLAGSNHKGPLITPSMWGSEFDT